MKNLILSIIAIAAAMSIMSCEKDNPEPKPEPKSNVETRVFDTRAFDKWVYFSFDEGKEVEITDFKTSMGWDIGFHRFDVRVNCGTSGPGNGGSINMGEVNFDDIKEAPTSGYSLNDSIAVVVKSGDWTNPVTVPGDTIIASWLYFTGPPPQYNITNNIYVVKTAEGKYAKIWLKDYYNDDSQSGFVKMQYLYQKGGSTKLE